MPCARLDSTSSTSEIALAKQENRTQQPQTKARRIRKPTQRQKSQLGHLLSSLKVERISLLSSEFSRHAGLEQNEIEEAKVSYGCVVNYFVDKGFDTFGICACNAKKESDDHVYVDIEATYFFYVSGITTPLRKEIDKVVEHSGKYLVWPRFQAYFNLVVSQTTADMPPLPITPNVKVTEQSFEELMQSEAQKNAE